MPAQHPISFRTCRICGASESNKKFCSRKTGNLCTECHNSLSRELYRRNLDRRRAQIKEYNKKHSEAIRAASERYKAKNPEHYKALQHESYLRTKEQRKLRRIQRRTEAPWIWQETTRAWRQQNRDKCRAYRKTRAGRERGAEGSFTAEDVAWINRQQRGKCANCKVSLKKGCHVDHIMPVVLGGSNNRENLQLLCPTCNRSKGAKRPEQWAHENGRLF